MSGSFGGAMVDCFDFNADEFMALSLAERITRCLRNAERAQALATRAEAIHERFYVAIANDWMALAAAMRKVLDEQAEPRPTGE